MKFNPVNHEVFQPWHVYMRDLMSQKQAWLEMCKNLPKENMCPDGEAQHKILEICDWGEGHKLAAEFYASKDYNTISYYIIDKEDGSDAGTQVLCGDTIFSERFRYTKNIYASDIAGSIYGFLTRNGYLAYN